MKSNFLVLKAKRGSCRGGGGGGGGGGLHCLVSVLPLDRRISGSYEFILAARRDLALPVDRLI